MIRDCKELREFEKRKLQKLVNFKRNIKIYEAMYKLSRKVLAGRKIDPLEGIELKIKIARVLNSV